MIDKRDELSARSSGLSRRQFAAAALGTGMGLAVGSAGAMESPRRASHSLDAWVARDGQGATSVVNPWYIDEIATADLAFYHPIAADPRQFLMRHVEAVDERGKPYAKLDFMSENWNSKWAEMSFALRLYPEKINGMETLRDRRIKDIETPLMHGWKVVDWLSVHNLDGNVQRIHQDFITWRKGDTFAKSMMGWLPYPPESAV